MKTKSTTSEKIYQLKVTLKGSKPPIWRRLLVSEDTTLYDLHRIIQVAMGWTNSHLHQFIKGDEYYGTPSEDDWQPVKDEMLYKLREVLAGEKDKMIYEYDFGDSWEHEIVVEKVMPKEDGEMYPRCLKARRACPPEDVGGIWGYEQFLAAMSDPTHEERESYMMWWGGEYNPDDVDVEEINEMLQNIEQMV